MYVFCSQIKKYRSKSKTFEGQIISKKVFKLATHVCNVGLISFFENEIISNIELSHMFINNFIEF